MNVVVRADASLDIGTGHVMRCLTLADELRRLGARVHFVCRDFEGNVNSAIASRGFDVSVLPASIQEVVDTKPPHARWLGTSWEVDARETAAVVQSLGAVNWLIVDHYALDKRWEQQMRGVVDQIMAIDDLADRAHDCDVLLDQNLYERAETRYKGLVPDNCRLYTGPSYALLRSEFREARASVSHTWPARRIVVFLGGVDADNVTARVLRALQMLWRSDIIVDVVVGTANPHKEEIRELCNALPAANYYCNVTAMAQLMAQADLAIGAGGTTTWERCCLGLPSIVFIVADNQREVAETAHRAGLAYTIGEAGNVSEKELFTAVERMIDDADALRSMSQIGMEVVDGCGALRIAKALVPIEV